MNNLITLTKRNVKLFFKDKGLFFSSLITPIILLVLYVTFLGKTYEEIFNSNIPKTFEFDASIIKTTVAGELISSLLAVTCVTVAFCSNLLMVQDKVRNSLNDFMVAPVKKQTIGLSYYFASFISTFIISFLTLVIGLIYIATVGWYLSFSDIMLLLLDTFLLTLFGTAISSICIFFLTSEGQASAVGTIVSAGYGFICGAYMPISNFGESLRNVLGFLPGTYGTSLFHNHFLNGVFNEMGSVGFPAEVVSGIRDTVDCNLYFYGENVPIWTMYLILIISIIVLIGIYILINILVNNKKK